MRAEVLLRTRRFATLLGELIEIEKLWSQSPEAIYAVAYLRAQCMFGLGRKFEAIDMLEGILNVEPQYRAAVALLAMWKRGS
jgi:hypothetical protein